MCGLAPKPLCTTLPAHVLDGNIDRMLCPQKWRAHIADPLISESAITLLSTLANLPDLVSKLLVGNALKTEIFVPLIAAGCNIESDWMCFIT